MNDLDDAAGEMEADIANELPASSQWMALLQNKYRPEGKVIGNVEWEYFKANVMNFQGRDELETDNYSSIRWSSFATSWNKWVDGLGVRHPEVTYKNASYLKQAYKSMQQRALQFSTLRQHTQGLDELRERHTNSDANQNFLGEFPMPENATVTHPVEKTTTGTPNSNDNDAGYQAEMSETENTRKRKHRQHRCRRCGKDYASPEWLPYHTNKIQTVSESLNNNERAKYLRNGANNKVWDNCTVDEAYYESGFPCLDTNKPLPRRKKSI